MSTVEVFKFIGRSSDHIIDGVGDGDEKLDVPEIMGKMGVGVNMMVMTMMFFSHDDDDFHDNDDDNWS